MTQPLTIGIDLRLIQRAFLRGMGRYTFQQLHAVIPHTPQHRYIFFCLSPIPPILEAFRAYPNVTFVARSPRYSLRIFGQMPQLAQATTRQFDRLAWDYRLDVLHIPIVFNFIQPIPTQFTTCPVVVNTYDFIPHLFPDQQAHMMPHQWAEYRRGLAFIAHADHQIAISYATQADTVRLLNYPQERITVAYPIPDPAFVPMPPDQAQPLLEALWAQLGRDAPPDAYFFTVSDHFYSKNLEGLLRAYAHLAPQIRQQCPLIITFDITPTDRARFLALCAEWGIDQQVFFTGRVDEALLVALYSHALAFVYPSRYEGFGYPVAEAFACGAPVITTDVSSLAEVGGNAALIVSPEETAQIADAMHRLYADPALRQRLREAGFVQVKQFSAHALQTQVAHAYHMAVGQGKPRPPKPPAPALHHRLILALWGIFSTQYYRRKGDL